ncbi:MAG: ClpXP protease specificity-enhancing factor [Caldimonas sp.]
MTTPIAPATAGTSTRPYLIRALHDWCTDNGFTPYIAVFVDEQVRVPREYVKNNEIVLNVGFEATSALKLGNDQIEFKARFGGTSREIAVPIDHVIAIYARENGQGMAFPMPSEHGGAGGEAGSPSAVKSAPSVTPVRGPRLAGSHPAGPRSTALTLSPVPGSQTREPAADTSAPPPPEPPPPKRPSLKRVK